MKKLSLLVILLLVASTINSQKKKRQLPKVEYDSINYLKDTSRVIVKKMPFNSRVGIKIYNINKKLVDINGDSQKTSFNEEAPKLFEKFSNTSFPSSSEGGEAGFANLLNKDSLLSNAIPKGTQEKINSLRKTNSEIEEKIGDIEKSLKDYRTDYKRVTTILQYQNDLISLQNVCNSTLEEILSEVLKLTKTTFDNSSGIDDDDRLLLSKNPSFIEVKTILNRHLSKVINGSKKNREKVINSILPSELDKINMSITKEKKLLKTIEDALLKIRKKDGVEDLLEEIKKIKEDNDLENRLKDIKYLIESFDLKKIHEDFSAFEKDGKKELLSAYDFFNSSNYTYYLNPVSITEDLTVLTVDISPKDDVLCPVIGRSYEVKVKANSGIKIDFSSGFFVNFGENDFLDQTYSLRPLENDSNRTEIVRNETKNSVNPSIGALMHVYKRSGNDIQLAGAFGLSVNNLENVNYHLGGSLIFGNSRRIVLNGGLTLGRAELIDDEFEVGQILDVEDAPDEIPTSTFNRLGYFISLTYNLSAK